MITVNIGGIEQFKRAMAQLGEAQLNQAMQRAGLKLAQTARSVLQRYPRRTHQVIWASEKQRRWYHAMRRAKGLPAQYTRMSDPMSQSLKHSWDTRTTTSGAILGTRVTYAPYVQSEELQQPMHRVNNWPTDYTAAQELEQRRLIERIVMAEVDSMVKKAFGGR